jgi:hypothetical protein
MTAVPNDVAISAVPYDSILVSELAERLAPRLRGTLTPAADAPLSPARLGAAKASVALILHQRLWGREPETRADATVLRARHAEAPGSVIVLRLDDSATPSWLSKAPRCDLGSAGLDGAAEFVLKAVRTRGGSPRPAPAAAATAAEKPHFRSFDEAPAFLSQGRAFSALRRELDSLSSELEPRLEAEEARCADRPVELHSLPNRVVARVGDVGVSFSWVSGRLGTVADGRLLVIEWNGVESVGRGSAVLNAAKPTREVVYHAEGTSAESWHWRSDDRHGRACSTANLVAEWIANATMGLEPSEASA